MTERRDLPTSTPGDGGGPDRTKQRDVVPWRSIWRVIAALLATAALLWALFRCDR